MSLSWRKEEEEWQLCLMADGDDAQHWRPLGRGRKIPDGCELAQPLSDEATAEHRVKVFTLETIKKVTF